MALGNLVLSRRDSLLLDAWSTVPAEELARLRYADLPSSPGIFPSPLLDFALNKMRVALNDALVQRTLHPPKIPRKSSSGPSKAGSSSASSADRGGASPVVPRSQQQASTAPSPPSSQQGRKKRGRKSKAPFSAAPATPMANEKVPGKSPPDGVSPLLRVGGCLSAHWRHWQTIGADSWVLSLLRDGYRIPFLDSPPPLSRTPISFPTYRAGSPRSLALCQEAEKMLSKDALEIVLDLGPGFYSHLFLVEKVTWGWRPVIDLSHLNEFVLQIPFKMEIVAFVLLFAREGDFLASIDEGHVFPGTRSSVVEKAIEVPVGGDSLSVQGPVLQAVDCPSGLHKGVCSCVCEGALPRDSSSQVPGRLAGPRLFGDGGQKERPGSALALSLPQDCDKREVRSRLLANYLGMTIDTGAARIFPSHARVEKFLSVTETFCTMSAPPAQLWQVVLGHLASLERLVPHSRFRMRSLQWHLKTHWSPESDPPSLSVPLSLEVREDLSLWMVRDHLL